MLCMEPNSAVRRLVTFNTKQGLCSLDVDFGSLGDGSNVSAVRKTPAMRGVPHFELRRVRELKKTCSEPLMSPSLPLLHSFGYTGQAYSPVASQSISRIPVPLRRQRTLDSVPISPSTDSGFSVTRHSLDDFNMSNAQLMNVGHPLRRVSSSQSLN